jgi:hypothetical protein
MREHNFMGEQRGPFKGGGSITVRTANQFVLAVGMFYEFGITELPDDLFAIAFGNQIF